MTGKQRGSIDKDGVCLFNFCVDMILSVIVGNYTRHNLIDSLPVTCTIILYTSSTRVSSVHTPPCHCLVSDQSELKGDDLLHIDSVLGQQVELGADRGGLVGSRHKSLQLRAGHDLHDGTEGGIVLHLLLEQGTQLLLGQDSDDGVQETAQSSGRALGDG